MTRRFQVIVSNGFARYCLADAAAELMQRGLLARLITGAYPNGAIWNAVKRMGAVKSGKWARLAARGVNVPPDRIDALWGAEAVSMGGMALRRLSKALVPMGDWFDVAGYRLYCHQAVRLIEKADASLPTIYHYRSGFGHGSVAAARARGMIILCEHTIAHPQLIDYLIDHDGQFPPEGARLAPKLLWRHVHDDVDQADHVVVNSDFVRKTFLHQGWSEDRVHVVSIGVDQPYLDHLPPRQPIGDPSFRLLFAGGSAQRKGFHILADALSGLDDVPWRLDILGGIDPDLDPRFSGFLADPRVQAHGMLPRLSLAERLAATDIFVFPSLAEGSARSVFEALANGCYVITTPNSGSIVEHERHGLLVSPGDVEGLRAALRRAFSFGRDHLAGVGAANAAVIRNDYNQSQYGDRLIALYDRLLSQHAASSESCARTS